MERLLREGKSRIEQVRSSALTVIHDLVMRHIVSACFIFIDSFDQALSNATDDDLDIWCAGQCGLLRAAWEVSRQNQHIQVYATIRQEAYASFADQERINIRGSVLLIEYSRDDLHNIFIKHIQHHEGLDTIEDFVGLPRIYNEYLRANENIFDYIHRHTVGVPRWLADLGEKLSEDGDGLSESQRRTWLRNVVNRESAHLAEDYLKTEMRPFFRGEKPSEFINKFLRAISGTVLSFNNLTRISQRYIEESPIAVQHPFCLLYNFGLLGYVRPEPGATALKQYFRKPYEFDWNFDHVLPADPNGHYLMHPALNELIHASNASFRTSRVRIGDGLAWRNKEESVVRRDTLRLFISYAHTDKVQVTKIVRAIERYLRDKCICDIWFDEWRMKAGEWVQDQLLRGLRESDYLVLMASKQSLGSSAVSVEWKTHFAGKLSNGRDSVLPLIIDDTPISDMPEFLTQIFCRRCAGDDETELLRFAEDLIDLWRTQSGTQSRSLSSGKTMK